MLPFYHNTAQKQPYDMMNEPGIEGRNDLVVDGLTRDRGVAGSSHSHQMDFVASWAIHFTPG